MALKEKASESIEGKGENAGTCMKHLLLFPPCFILSQGKINPVISDVCNLLSAKTFNLHQAKHLVVWLQCLDPFPNKPLLLHVCRISLLKALCEKEKLLITSNFLFSHRVFYPFGEFSTIFIKLKIDVCKLLSIWTS